MRLSGKCGLRRHHEVSNSFVEARGTMFPWITEIDWYVYSFFNIQINIQIVKYQNANRPFAIEVKTNSSHHAGSLSFVHAFPLGKFLSDGSKRIETGSILYKLKSSFLSPLLENYRCRSRPQAAYQNVSHS